MIKYKLQCKKCSKTFDSWFSSSREFERIKKLKLLNCNYCKSKNIDNAPRTTSTGDVYVGGLKVKAVSGVDSSKLKLRINKK